VSQSLSRSPRSKAHMAESAAKPLVSILICLYNAERFLASTLNSALSQSHRDFELIVIDDGSTDGSRAVLDTYTDPRVRVISQSNQGAAAALKAGLQAAQGVYIAPLDSDDLWEPESLATHVKALESHPGIALTFSWFRVIDEMGREIGISSNHFRGTIGFAGLLTDFVVGATSNVVIRKSAIEEAGGVDPNIPRLYDLDMCLRVSRLGNQNVAAIPSELMRYRRRSGQLSRDLAALKREWVQVLDKLRGVEPLEVAKVEKRARSNMSRYFARLAFESGQYAVGLQLLREGFQYAPATFVADRRNWLTGAACMSGLLMPAEAHRRLERLAGLRRSGPAA
jgi:glycosyltransferase involved in cell wall biosynthesis